MFDVVSFVFGVLCGIAITVVMWFVVLFVNDDI